MQSSTSSASDRDVHTDLSRHPRRRRSPSRFGSTESPCDAPDPYIGPRRQPDIAAISDRTKAEGEEAVRAAFPQATIVRPSLVFGEDDHFFSRFAALIRSSPVLPLIGGGTTKFQPVFVGDMAEIWENDVTAVGIDNFVSYVVENPHWQMTIDPDTLVDPKRHLYENLKEFRGEARVEIIESDFRKVDYEDLGKASKFNVYMYDGPHKEQDQYDGITMALPALADKFVLIADDWNWEQVRKGTMTATLDCEIDWLLGVEIMTQVIHDNQVQAHTFGAPYFFQNSDWHNGYFIGVYKRRE